jgi:hypothetical protein
MPSSATGRTGTARSSSATATRRGQAVQCCVARGCSTTVAVTASASVRAGGSTGIAAGSPSKERSLGSCSTAS